MDYQNGQRIIKDGQTKLTKRALLWLNTIVLAGVVGVCLAAESRHDQRQDLQTLGKPTKQLVDTIEAILQMPEGAYPLQSYVRYYSQQVIGNDRFVIATFV